MCLFYHCTSLHALISPSTVLAPARACVSLRRTRPRPGVADERRTENFHRRDRTRRHADPHAGAYVAIDVSFDSDPSMILPCDRGAAWSLLCADLRGYLDWPWQVEDLMDTQNQHAEEDTSASVRFKSNPTAVNTRRGQAGGQRSSVMPRTHFLPPSSYPLSDLSLARTPEAATLPLRSALLRPAFRPSSPPKGARSSTLLGSPSVSRSDMRRRSGPSP